MLDADSLSLYSVIRLHSETDIVFHAREIIRARGTSRPLYLLTHLHDCEVSAAEIRPSVASRNKAGGRVQKLTFWDPMYVLPNCRESAVEKVIHSEVLDALYAKRCTGV